MARQVFRVLGCMLLGGAGTAHAQGARVELRGGYEQLNNRSFFSPSDFTFRPIKAAVFGLGVGYDVPLSETLFAGIEATAEFSTGSRCQVNPLILAPGIFESCLDPGRDLGANARLGAKLGKTRIYGLMGYSNARFVDYFQINRGPSTSLASNNRDGVRLGFGIEQDLSSLIYGKVEYRYADYGSNINRNQGMVAVGLRF